MSDRMRSIKKELPGLTISHKSYALGWEPEDFIAMFGSREAVKSEVLTHWVHANENDEQHRFNIEEPSVDFEKWFVQFNSTETNEVVRQDLTLAAAYGLQGVPALVVNEKYLISGAQPKKVIIQTLTLLMEQERSTLEEIGTNAEACRFDNDKWTCD